MTRPILLVERPADWPADDARLERITARDYLRSPELAGATDLQVINLCRSYRYQSVGYYCALLAEARGHRVLPTVRTMLTLTSRHLYSLDVEDLDDLVEHSLKKAGRGDDEVAFVLDIFFGHTEHAPLAGLARQLFETLPCPLLQVEFQYREAWRIKSLKALPVQRLDTGQQARAVQGLGRFLRRRKRGGAPRVRYRYDLAILHNPSDPMPPSNERALKNFIRAGRAQGVDVELLQARDAARLAEFDALFIRDTTRINHYTYRLARKAESEDMVVIDDPTSILLCTNKVFLDELLAANGLPRPRSRILHKADLPRLQRQVEASFDYPVVLKMPEGAFSSGVFKAGDADELRSIAGRLFKESELILAQEWLYTEFDWRIGILNRTPIYACQYFMSRRHWQIVKHGPDGKLEEGGFRSWAIGEVPPEVVSAALGAANLIGDGLYGVDVKQNADGVYVIEVNDNPNIDAGIEDVTLKAELYNLIMRDFVRRLDRRHQA